MDIIPSDLATYGGEAKNLLRDLQSRNERMFLLTLLVLNLADTKQKLDNEVFGAAAIAQKRRKRSFSGWRSSLKNTSEFSAFTPTCISAPLGATIGH